jgi:hypothetical protein
MCEELQHMEMLSGIFNEDNDGKWHCSDSRVFCYSSKATSRRDQENPTCPSSGTNELINNLFRQQHRWVSKWHSFRLLPAQPTASSCLSSPYSEAESRCTRQIICLRNICFCPNATNFYPGQSG